MVGVNIFLKGFFLSSIPWGVKKLERLKSRHRIWTSLMMIGKSFTNDDGESKAYADPKAVKKIYHIKEFLG